MYQLIIQEDTDEKMKEDWMKNFDSSLVAATEAASEDQETSPVQKGE